MSEHTPGPWRLDCTHISAHVVATTGFHVTSLPIGSSYWNRRDEWFQTVDGANARLIAAAPDLLEALQVYVEEGGCPTCDGNGACGTRGCALDKARAAIAKATGKGSGE